MPVPTLLIIEKWVQGLDEEKNREHENGWGKKTECMREGPHPYKIIITRNQSPVDPNALWWANPVLVLPDGGRVPWQRWRLWLPATFCVHSPRGSGSAPLARLAGGYIPWTHRPSEECSMMLPGGRSRVWHDICCFSIWPHSISCWWCWLCKCT